MKFGMYNPSPLAGEVRRGGSASWLVFPVSPSPSLSLDGRGGVWSEQLASIFGDSGLDFSENTLEVPPNLRIPETQNAKALACKKFVTNFISGAIQMLAAVCFNNYFMFKANKIENISINRLLSAKLCIKMFAAQMFPQDSFFWGHGASKFTGNVRQSHKYHYELTVEF
jgi:hypothetical protein